MKNLAILEYMFMFDPADTWSHLNQFEGSLRDFFTQNGLEAQIVSSVNGQPGKRMLLIKKVDKIPEIKPPKQHDPKAQLQKMGRK